MKQKNCFLVSQKQAKMKRNKMCFASFRFEAKIKKERKRDTLGSKPERLEPEQHCVMAPAAQK
jgi:hypothetical protein